MDCSRTYTVALLAGVITLTGANAANRVTIVNNNNTPVQVDLTIPEYTEAKIKLNKITSAQSIKIQSQELLYKAIVKNSVADIKKAIQAGADVNYTKDGKSALVLAVLLKRDDAIQCLLDNGAKSNKTIIEYALKMGAIKAAHLLIKKSDANINAIYHVNGQDCTMLQLALQNQDFETVLMLIKSGTLIKDISAIGTVISQLSGLT